MSFSNISFIICPLFFQSYNEYGDIIKTTLGKAREINKTNCARTMVTSLISLFKELQRDAGSVRINRQLDEFSSLKVRFQKTA